MRTSHVSRRFGVSKRYWCASVQRNLLKVVQTLSFSQSGGCVGFCCICLQETRMGDTHKPGTSLYKAFSDQGVRRIAEKLEFHYTPKHGSWLNMAEIELSVLRRQCLWRRIPDQETLKREVQAWQNRRNQRQATVHWQFKTDNARIKLKRLYPSIEC